MSGERERERERERVREFLEINLMVMGRCRSRGVWVTKGEKERYYS